jgi:hypothetical protein
LTGPFFSSSSWTVVLLPVSSFFWSLQRCLGRGSSGLCSKGSGRHGNEAEKMEAEQVGGVLCDGAEARGSSCCLWRARAAAGHGRRRGKWWHNHRRPQGSAAVVMGWNWARRFWALDAQRRHGSSLVAAAALVSARRRWSIAAAAWQQRGSGCARCLGHVGRAALAWGLRICTGNWWLNRLGDWEFKWICLQELNWWIDGWWL